MSEQSIDQLTISIDAKAQAASSKLRSLATDVRTLGSATGQAAPRINAVSDALRGLHVDQNVANTMKGVAKAAQGLSGVKISSTVGKQLGVISDAAARLGNAGNINKAASAIGQLSSVRVSSSIARQMSGIADAAAKLDSARMDTTKVNDLAKAMTTLSAVPKSSISSTINALRRLPEAAQSLHSMDFKQLTKDCRQLSLALGQLPGQLSGVNSRLKAVGSEGANAFGKVGKAARSASSETDNAVRSLARMAQTINNVSTVIGLIGMISHGLSTVIDAANRYIEDMNLFNVSLGEYADQAEAYANRVNAVLGIQPQTWLRNQGTFNTIAEGMGIASDSAATMSQQLTQLSYDLASFYNISEEDAFEKVQAGLTGQIRPLRELGFDLSEARMQEDALKWGISDSVEEMTQAEKACLRYREMLTQVSWAQGDMARTIESPANQLRVFKDTLGYTARSIGTVFLPMLQAILPVATAAAKVVATLANMIANLTGGTQIASVDYGGGGAPSAPSTAAVGGGDDGTAADNLAKKYKGVGNAAKGAADKVKELKRQTMSFDELNKFSEQSTGSGGSGGSGGGGGGGGKGGSGGGGGTGASSMPLQTYDFLGDAKGLGDGIYDAIMSAVKRAAMAFAPLVEAVKSVIDAIASQFEGLDIAGAAENAFMGFLNLVSNVARGVVEVIGPMVVAFNFPETLAYSFDLVAQMCLTLSAQINAVQSALHVFTEIALVPFVAWIGDKVRGAIVVCIDELGKWQDWFQRNLGSITELGQWAGYGAAGVLTLAQAVADPAFAVAEATFRGIGDGARWLSDVLVNSAAARTAAMLLGASLTAWALGQALAVGLNGIGTAFTWMATVIENKAASISSSTDGIAAKFTTTLPNAARNAGDSIGLLGIAFDDLRSAAEGPGTPLGALRDGLDDLHGKLGLAKADIEAYASEHLHLKSSVELGNRASDLHIEKMERLAEKTKRCGAEVEKASDKLRVEKSRLDDSKRAAQETGLFTDRLKVSVQRCRVATEQQNAKVAESKLAYARAREQLNLYREAGLKDKATKDQLVSSERKAAAGIVTGTVARGACTVATGALTVATKLLSAALNAIPGMLIATVIGIIADKLLSLVQGPIEDFLNGLFGISDAQTEVTSTTEEANQVLDDEQQKVQDNVKAIEDYSASHDNLADALEAANVHVDDFAQHLADTGQTFDDVMSKQEQYVDSTINGFDRIDNESQISLDTLVDNLNKNADQQHQWSDDIQALMEATGRGSNDAMIQGLLSAGPGKVQKAVEEALNDPSGQAMQKLEDAFANAGSVMSPTFAANLEATADQMYGSSKRVGTMTAVSLAEGIDEGKTSVAQSSSDTAGQAVDQMESHTEDAKTAGGDIGTAFSDGLSGSTEAVTTAASAISQAAVTAFNGGDGYNAAYSAGANMTGGFSDGLAGSIGLATSVAYGAEAAVANALNGGAGYNDAYSAAANMMGGFAAGLSSAISRARDAGRRAALEAQSGMGSNYNGAKSAGRNEMGGFCDGLSEADVAYSKGRAAALSAQSGAGSNYWGAYDSGKNFGWGFANGIDSTSSTVYRIAYNLGVTAINAARRATDERSPSKKMRQVGVFFGQGMGIGIDASVGDVARKSREMAQRAIASVGDAGAAGRRIGAAIGSGFSDGVSVVPTAMRAAFSEAEAVARTADASSWGVGTSRRSAIRHAPVPSLDDDATRRALVGAIEYGVASAMESTQGSGEGTVEVVLRVGNEELARAVAKGQQSLDRRGASRGRVEFR